jgi:hypothetical protein
MAREDQARKVIMVVVAEPQMLRALPPCSGGFQAPLQRFLFKTQNDVSLMVLYSSSGMSTVRTEKD